MKKRKATLIKQKCTEIGAVRMKSSELYLDADRCFSHPDKLLPLQPGSESPLQRDDASENFSVE